MLLRQHVTQAKSLKQAKQPFTKFQYDCPLDLNHSSILKDNKQTFSTNRLFSRLSRHISKFIVTCHNKKVGKSGKEINNILYHLLAISLFTKVKVSLNLHFFLFHVN